MVDDADMPALGKGRRIAFLAAMGAAAAACAALAALLGTDAWAAWFRHPAQNRLELTRQGAVLWRIMLAVAAVTIVMAAAVLVRVSAAETDTRTATLLSRKRLGAIIGLLGLGLLLRATRLNESLWYDEIASWMTYAGGAKTAGALIGNFFDPINHAAHTLLNWLSINVFLPWLGTEIAFRLPALVFSLGSIVVMYGLGATALGERAGLIAGALAAVLPVSVLEGAEARGYSMMICFAAATTWTLLTARSRQRPELWVLYAALAALGIWSHFVTAFVSIGHAFWIVWRGVRWREWRFALCGFTALALAAVLTLTLYSPMIPGMLAARGMFAAVRTDQPTILGPEGWHALLQLGGSWYWWAALPGLMAGGIGLVSVVRGRVAVESANFRGCEAASGAVELATLGLPLMLIVVALSGSWMYARFTLFVLPGAILLMAAGIDALWRWHRVAGLCGLGLIALCSIADLALRSPKQPLRGAADFVREHWQQDDRLLVIGLAHEVLRVYADDLNLTYSLRHGADLPQKLQRVRPQWIIVEYPNSVKPENYQLIQAAGFIEATRLPGWVDWTNGDVVVYRRR